MSLKISYVWDELFYRTKSRLDKCRQAPGKFLKYFEYFPFQLKDINFSFRISGKLLRD